MSLLCYAPAVNVLQWSNKAERSLKDEGIATARLDILVLLEDATGQGRAWILANPSFELSKKTLDTLNKQLRRRAHHEPLAYIRGKSEFFGREFKITSATLQPRPETETMIEVLKKLRLPSKPVIADIGTGSGAIAITAKLELPNALVSAIEINTDALKVAQQNAKALKADVEFYEGNLLEPIVDQKIDIILANLPYVPDGFTINQAAMQEPSIAIFGGEDGLDIYRRLFLQISQLAQKPLYVLTESLPFQHLDLQKFAQDYGYKLQEAEDFIQLFEYS